MARALLGAGIDFKHKVAQSEQYLRHVGGRCFSTELWTVLKKLSFISTHRDSD